MKLIKHFYSILLFIAVLLSSSSVLVAQCVSFQEVEFINPSFEGPNGSHITPSPWSSCGFTADTQPGEWGETQIASDGNTYVGFVYSNSWIEGAAQELQSPLVAGVSYGFTVDLSASAASGGGINPNSYGLLEVWAANNLCDKTELLWSSPIIDHLGWQAYNVSFIPSNNYTHIYFLNNGQQELGYLLVDNISNYQADPTIIGITSHTDSALVDCSFNLSGLVDEATIDSIVLEGNFNESPLSIAVSAAVWDADISSLNGGFQTLIATAYYTDTLNNAAVCSISEVLVEVQTPSANFSYVSACPGAVITFSDLSTTIGGNTITDWAWNFDDGTTSDIQNPNHSFNLSGTYSVALELTSSDGCEVTFTEDVTVYESPVADFSFDETCVGDTTLFTDLSLTDTSSIAIWQWNFGDGDTSFIQNPWHLYADTSEYTVSLIVTNVQGCSDTAETIYQGLVTPEVFWDYGASCNSSAIPFFNGSSFVDSTTTWLWEFGDGDTSTLETPTHVYDSIALYFPVTLHAQLANGCSSSNSLNIALRYSPQANFTFTEVCLGGSTNFHDFSLPLGGPVTMWSWDFGDGNSSFDQNPTHTYAAPGEYEVELVALGSNWCGDTLTQLVEVFQCTSSVIEADDAEYISIYPNPASDLVVIRSEGEPMKQINLMDASGKLVRSSTLLTGNSHSFTVPVNKLAAGFYHLVVTLDSGVLIHQRLVVD